MTDRREMNEDAADGIEGSLRAAVNRSIKGKVAGAERDGLLVRLAVGVYHLEAHGWRDKAVAVLACALSKMYDAGYNARKAEEETRRMEK